MKIINISAAGVCLMHRNNEKITKEFCRGKRLIFFPQTSKEAEFIQQQAFALGYKCENSDRGAIDNYVSKGMVLRDGTIFSGPGIESMQMGFFCSSNQFEENYMSFEDTVLARLQAIEKTQKEILAELRPKTLDKPRLPGPRSGWGN